MAKNFPAFILGLLFGLGLIVAKMTNPGKVLAFLDVAGDWDPSLAFVMASALLVLGVTQRLLPAKADPDQAGDACDRPSAGVDARLIGGAAIFGVGWGLSGICPGPAIVGLTSGIPGVYVFAGAMFAGFALFNFLHRRR